MLTQWHMHAHILNVMVVVIISDIVGNEEHCIVKVVVAHRNLTNEENEPEVDPVDTMSKRYFTGPCGHQEPSKALPQFLDNPLLINVIFS